MKTFLSFAVLFLSISAIAQVPQGNGMRATNGIAFGLTVIGGRFISTNALVTNQIAGKLLLGNTDFSLLGTETVIVNSVVTNPTTHVQETRSALNVTHTSVNSDSLHAGFTSTAVVGAGNTADWTNSSYPQLMGYNASLQSVDGSSGIIRKAAAYSGTIAGTVPGSGAIIDEGVIFLGDTANASGNNLSNIVGFKMSGLDAGWNNTGIWLGDSQTSYPTPGNWGVWDETGYPSFFDGNVSVGVTNTTNTLNVGAGTLTTTSKALSVTGILASSANIESGVDITITGAAGGTSFNRALNVSLGAGYNGAQSTFGGAVLNLSLGTGASVWNAGAANYGLSVSASGAGTGHKVAVFGNASQSGTLNIGAFGRAASASGSPLINVGVNGFALNASTANVGGFFGLMATAPTIANSAALIADNGATTDSIILWRDNGSIIGGIADGGVIHGDGSGITNLPVATQLWFTNPAAASSISNAYNVATTGSLGVGTTTPLLKLDVDGAVKISGYIHATNAAQTNTLSGPFQQEGKAYGTASAAFGLFTEASSLSFATGRGNRSLGSGSLVSGTTNTIFSGGQNSLVGGSSNTVGSPNNFAVGSFNAVNGNNSAAIGSSMSFDSEAHNSIGIGSGIFFQGTPSNTIAISAGLGGTTVTRSNSFSVNAPSGSFFSGGPVSPDAGILWQGGAQLTNIYTATATLDFGNVATIGCADLTIAVTGAALGDVVDLGVPNASVVANSSYSAWVSSADTVTVRFCALISGDPASGVFRAEVHKWK